MDDLANIAISKIVELQSNPGCLWSLVTKKARKFSIYVVRYDSNRVVLGVWLVETNRIKELSNNTSLPPMYHWFIADPNESIVELGWTAGPRMGGRGKYPIVQNQSGLALGEPFDLHIS